MKYFPWTLAYQLHRFLERDDLATVTNTLTASRLNLHMGLPLNFPVNFSCFRTQQVVNLIILRDLHWLPLCVWLLDWSYTLKNSWDAVSEEPLAPITFFFSETLLQLTFGGKATGEMAFETVCFSYSGMVSRHLDASQILVPDTHL